MSDERMPEDSMSALALVLKLNQYPCVGTIDTKGKSSVSKGGDRHADRNERFQNQSNLGTFEILS